MVEVEDLGEEVAASVGDFRIAQGFGSLGRSRREAAGGEDGVVECGVSVFQGIRAGQLQRAIHTAQAAGDLRESAITFHLKHEVPE